MRLVTTLLLAIATLAALPGRAGAEQNRDGIPWFALRLSAFSGIPDVLGVSATAYPWRTVAVEGGVGTLIFAMNAHVRAGPSFPLYNGRSAGGSGASLFLTPLVGYRYMETVPFDTTDRFHGINAVLAVDAAWWFARHFGLGLQLAGGGAFWVAGTSEGAPPVVPDVRLSLGVLF